VQQITAAELRALGYDVGPARRRSWPYPATPLEILATRAGLDDDELRALLGREIQHRRSGAQLGRSSSA
jgi:hypothetical protein